MTRAGGKAAALAALAVPVVVYLLAAGLTLRRLAPSGDAASVWSAPGVHRTVLCVREGEDRPRLLLAAAVEDGALPTAELSSREVRRALGPLAVVHADHTYRARLELFGLSIPWMVNDYTGGFPEWAPRLAAAATGRMEAGTATHVLGGALVLLLAAGIALRLGGPPAAAATGLLLATDLWFHVYKKLLNGTDVWLQGLALLVAAGLAAAIARRDPRPAVAAAFAAGLGLHVKAAFAGVVLAAGLAALPFLPGLLRGRVGESGASPRARRRSAGRFALLLAVALGLGSAPTWAYWGARSAVPEAASWGRGQERASDRVRELVGRARGGPPGDKAAVRAAQERQKRYGTRELLLRPRAWWRRYFAARAGESGPRAAFEPAWEPLDRAGAAGSALLLGFALWGAVRRFGPARAGPGGAVRRATACLSLAAVFAAVSVRLLHPDPHHVGTWIPLAAVALGVLAFGPVGAEGPGARNARRLLVPAFALALLARGADLARVDGDIVELAGGFTDRQGLERLADAVAEEGGRAPAVLQYELMSLLEGASAGAIRPFHYARALRGEQGADCLPPADVRWAAALLRAHRGDLVVEAAGPPSDPRLRALRHRRPEEEWEAAARAAGVSQRVVRVLEDERGRWLATIRRVDGAEAKP